MTTAADGSLGDGARGPGTTDEPSSEGIALSLVSHTNVGKTTLARTLLGRDVGTVRDAPHVTEFADAYSMLELPQGEQLQLWDTPGFGDSARLVKRLRASGNPIGWFLSQVWDRFRDRPFWASQQAMHNVRAHADAVLYLVSAAEEPAAAGYVAPEMALLAWLGKPVIVLLNQLGPPGDAAAEAAEVQRWRKHVEHLPERPPLAAVLPLDAFARCWVQELTLLRAVHDALPIERRPLMAQFIDAWQARRETLFEASMRATAESLARIALAREPVRAATGLRDRLRAAGSTVGAAIGLSSGEAAGPSAEAQRALAQALEAEVRGHTTRLLELHGLQGQAQGEILSRVAAQYDLKERLDEGKAALLGGIVTGALAGLKADIATGGLTLGGGMLAGGLLGALGAAGIARGVNLVRGTDQSWVSWNPEALQAMTEAALLRYLAVAHFGRGRGEWVQSEYPPHWAGVVGEVLATYREALADVWARRRELGAEKAALALEPPVSAAGRGVLERLYPAGDGRPT